ncbi:MAG TPA: peptidoglycan DD-metalloendopeptidase family protein [Kofleriaceae bacterium]|nr:peptidoglycan DD-metalloendopeptidase family protein [Kofleriaceae bacterium]
MTRSTLLLLLVAGSLACSGDVTFSSQPGPDGGGGGAPDGGAAEPEPQRRARVAGTGGVGLNLRAEPSTEAEVLALMPEGAVVDILSGPDGDWYHVRFQDQEGHAFAEYLVEIEEGEEPEGSGGFLNLLPWTAQLSYRVSRAHGDTGGHTGDSYWAWDFAMPVGTPVLAAHDGTVRKSRAVGHQGCCSPSCGDYANYVVIDRGDGTESLYLHLSKALVSAGDHVTRGDLIGKSGESGYACGAHLHFQMQKSPSGGGTSFQYNKSVEDFFHDSGNPRDPGPGDTPVSKNGVLDIP